MQCSWKHNQMLLHTMKHEQGGGHIYLLVIIINILFHRKFICLFYAQVVSRVTVFSFVVFVLWGCLNFFLKVCRIEH